MSRAWAGGSTRSWRRVRAAVLDRDGWLCRLRLPGCTTEATCVHHLRGKAHGDDPRWCVAACKSCNVRVGEPDADPAPAPHTRW